MLFYYKFLNKIRVLTNLSFKKDIIFQFFLRLEDTFKLNEEIIIEEYLKMNI